MACRRVEVADQFRDVCACAVRVSNWDFNSGSRSGLQEVMKVGGSEGVGVGIFRRDN